MIVSLKDVDDSAPRPKEKELHINNTVDATLKIDFIDESVALNNDQEISDYIGSARFPLRLVEDQQKTHVIPIINQKNMTMGQVELQLCFFNQGS